MLHRPRGAQGGRREQAPREQGPPPRPPCVSACRATRRVQTCVWDCRLGAFPALALCGPRSPRALSVVPSHLMGFLWHWRAGRGLGGADLIILSFQKKEKPRPQEERRAA